MLTLRKRRMILAISVLAFFAMAPVVIFYTLGYRLNSSLKIGRTGGLYVSSPVTGSGIYIEARLEKTTNLLQSGIFFQNLVASVYPIVVAKEGYWPWFKQLSVKEGQVAETRAILVSKNPTGKTILKGNFSGIWASPHEKIILLEEKKADGVYATFYLPETNTFFANASSETSRLLFFKNGISKIFWENGSILLKGEKNVTRAVFNTNNQAVKAEIQAISDFSVDHKTDKLSANQKQHLWHDNKTNAVWIEWLGDMESIPYYLCDKKPCEEKKYFISNFSHPVKNADFMPGRRDIIMAAARNSVFALEVDGRGGRMSFPIYKGKDPTFAVFPNEKSVYVLDDGVLSIVNLE